MAGFTIRFTESAAADLAHFRAYERKQILVAVRSQLSYEPLTPTANRKTLRSDTISRWELRIGSYRVFYDVDEAESMVDVLAVGQKVHDQLYIRGRRVHI